MLKTLVSSEELASHPEWRVFDCRHDLAKPGWGEDEYRKSHIPGALFAHLDRDLSAPKTGKNGRHPLPEPENFTSFIEKSGIHLSDQVICYDQGPGAYAARLWWMLRWAGHDAVAVLDGGLAKWLKEGGAVTPDMPSFGATSYPAKFRDISVGVETVSKAHPFLLLDARAPVRFRGEQESIDPVAGHIPGALNRFNSDNLDAAGVFKSPGVLRSEFEKILGENKPETVVSYCGSGVAACHNLLAMEVAGLSGAKLYAGSWSEWIADPARPRVKK